ncbi:MAG: ABC transporter permease [Pseudomonadota bacterium]
MTARSSRRANPMRFPRSMPTTRAVFALILREMSVGYGRSAGGYVWAVLEPVLGIFLLTFLFSLAFRSPPLGASFPLFYATGLVPFLFYTELSTKVSHALKFSRKLLVYPAVSFVDAILARFALHAIVQVFVGYIIFTALLIGIDTRAVLDPAAVVLAYAMAAALALGIGAMNCVLVSLLPVWQQIWSIFNRPLFLISCIFFLFEGVPEPLRNALWWNPLVHIVGQMRRAFYPTYDGSYISPIFVFGLAGLCLMIGLVFLNRYHRDIIHG